MKKHTINISINIMVPEKQDIENVILKVADLTESFCASIPSKAKSKVNTIKESLPSNKEEFVTAVKEKAPASAKKLVNDAKTGVDNLGNKAKALKEATYEAGRMIGSAFSETVALFADTASASAAIFADTAKTIAGNYTNCVDDCDVVEEVAEVVEEIAEAVEESAEGEEQADGEDGEDDLIGGQLACDVPQNKSEPVFACYLLGGLFNTISKGFRLIENAINQTKSDVKLIREKDPAASGNLEVLFLYSGLHAVMAHRVAHFLNERGFTVTARAISQITKTITGIEIHPGATIGKGLFIDHGTGVVIGETAIIGDNCTIYQGVTLGGTGKQTGKRHPTLLDGVMVGAGAKVLGPVVIGNNSKIAAGAVVLSDIPDHSTAVGIPARVVKCKNVRVDELDQIHIPDPISQELCKLNIRLEAAEKELKLINRGKE